jgi:hypothetical protein
MFGDLKLELRWNFKVPHASGVQIRDVITDVFGWKCPSGRPPASAVTRGCGKNRVRAGPWPRVRADARGRAAMGGENLGFPL